MPTKRFELDSTSWKKVAEGAAVVDVVEGCGHVLVHCNTVEPNITTRDYHTLRWGGKDTFSYGQGEEVYLRALNDDAYAVVTSERVVL